VTEQSEFVRQQGERAKEVAQDQRERSRGNGVAGSTNQRRHFELIRFDEIKLGNRRRYVVKNLVPREGLIVVWGPPKCGKSFWLSDLALHVALGWPYRERRVEAGAVIYVTCEGQSGFPARIEAFRRRKLADNNTDPLLDPPFFLLPTRLDLVGEIDALIADISAQIGEAGCILIVIDTLNRSLVGSESKDEDMSAYVRACDRLREAFKCAVIVVHHCGTNDQRPRGHTSLTGATDAQIEVKRDKAGNIVATIEFMKDGPEGDKIVSRLAVVDLGSDEDGERTSSCVVEPSDAMAQSGRAKALRGQAAIAFRMLEKALADAGRPPPDTKDFPRDRSVIPLSRWRAYCQKGGLAEGHNDETFKTAWKRVRHTLQNGGHIGVWNDFVWIVDPQGDKGT
jgi:AAA domain